MMTKNETFSRGFRHMNLSPMGILTFVTCQLAQYRVFRKVASFYTFLLDEEVSAVQAVYYFYAQLLFLGLSLPISYGGGWRMCMFILLILSVRTAMGEHFGEKND